MNYLVGAGVALSLCLAGGRAEPPQAPAAQQGVVVETTRSLRPIDDQAVPVDLIKRETIERKMLGTPASVAPALGELAGLRIDSTSPTLGTSVVRIQGLPGRYTRLLFDGVPLFGDRPLGLGLVQIPPIDIDRIEVIQGPASAFYGADSPAGTINFLSRRPGPVRTGEVLFSQSARGATDAALWFASTATSATKSWAGSMMASAHRQEETDVNDDGWSDLPRVERMVLRPRAYWTNHKGRTIAGVAGVTFEKRGGGSSIQRDSFDSKSADGGMSGEMVLKSGRILAGAGALFAKSRTREFGGVRERDRQQTATIDLELRGQKAKHNWVSGMSIEWYGLRSLDALPSTYISTRGGLFFHDDMHVSDRVVVSGSARIDHHNRFGIRFSPRGSALVRAGAWSARVSAALGYYAPNLLMEDTEAAGLSRLKFNGLPDIETARNVSVDLTHKSRAADFTLRLFQSRLENPALVDRATYTLRNDPNPIDTRGIELFGTVRQAPFVLTGAYTFVHPRQNGRDFPRTPRHSANIVAMVTAKDRYQAGVEISFTSKQQLEANPYRSASEPFTTVGLFAEHRVGRFRIFVNADNLTNVRQTDWDPILRQAQHVDGRWTVDAWAPLVGRLINGGIKVLF